MRSFHPWFSKQSPPNETRDNEMSPFRFMYMGYITSGFEMSFLYPFLWKLDLVGFYFISCSSNRNVEEMDLKIHPIDSRPVILNWAWILNSDPLLPSRLLKSTFMSSNRSQWEESAQHISQRKKWVPEQVRDLIQNHRMKELTSRLMEDLLKT